MYAYQYIWSKLSFKRDIHKMMQRINKTKTNMGFVNISLRTHFIAKWLDRINMKKIF